MSMPDREALGFEPEATIPSGQEVDDEPTRVRNGLPEPDENGNFFGPTALYAPGIKAPEDAVTFTEDFPRGATYSATFYQGMRAAFGEATSLGGGDHAPDSASGRPSGEVTDTRAEAIRSLGEVADIQTQISDLRVEVAALGGAIGEIKDEMRARFARDERDLSAMRDLVRIALERLRWSALCGLNQRPEHLYRS